jgi:mannitol-specific phosphotransferase system IIBC component
MRKKAANWPEASTTATLTQAPMSCAACTAAPTAAWAARQSMHCILTLVVLGFEVMLNGFAND